MIGGLEDIRGQYRRAENFMCLHPISVVSRDDVRAEVLKVLLGARAFNFLPI